MLTEDVERINVYFAFGTSEEHIRSSKVTQPHYCKTVTNAELGRLNANLGVRGISRNEPALCP